MLVSKPKIVDLRDQIPTTNFRKGRNSIISQISEHHIVGDAKHAIAKAKIVGREFSCTFTIGVDGTIYQLVDIFNRPFTDNDYRSNDRAITIEHAGGHANYPYTEAMYKSSIHLHAWLFQEFGMLNCVKHRDIPEIKANPQKATACPGGLDVARIVRQAKEMMKGEDMTINRGIAIRLWRIAAHMGGDRPTEKEIKSITGKDIEKVLDDMRGSDWFRKHSAAVANYDTTLSELTKLKKTAEELAGRPTQEAFDELRKQVELCEQRAVEASQKEPDAVKPVSDESSEPQPSLITRLIAYFQQKFSRK